MPVRDSEWEISVHEVKRRLDASDGLLLIDVREPKEHAIGRIEGATLIPLGQLASRLEDVRRLAAGKTIVAHCHHGGRSLSAAAILREGGFPGAKSMAGGIDEWSVLIDPSVPRY